MQESQMVFCSVIKVALTPTFELCTALGGENVRVKIYGCELNGAG
jgi:hypothetical protein